MKRRLGILFLTLVVTLIAAAGDESLEGLKARAATESGKELARIATKVARLELELANNLYTSGDSQQALAHVTIALEYAEKATVAATSTHKRLKDTEIDVRKLTRRLEEIHRTLTLEDREPLTPLLKRLDEMRKKLLEAMFGLDKKRGEDE